jgi:two-component system response regulator HydG
MKSTVLVVDDDRSTREALCDILTREGYEVLMASTGREGLDLIGRHEIDLVLADLVMPEVNGLAILKAALDRDAAAQVIVITGYGTVETAVDAMRQGAHHYLCKPVNPRELKELIRKALEQRRLERENQELKSENQALKKRLDAKFGTDAIIGNSAAIERLRDLVGRIASSRSTVLICGESGTGKELVASCMHHNSPRSKAPFIKVNCAALVESLLESELFGHCAGAFTSAIKDKAGKFEAAHGGTILLDEIAEMSLTTQAKFLRVLQEGEFERVGEVKPRKADVRVIAATNRNLEERVASGAFREDLYFRLKVTRIDLPPLRERREDVPLFVAHFLPQIAKRDQREVDGISPAVMERLLAYPWRGNVRELRNVLEAMVVTTRNRILQVEDLPPEIANHRGGPARFQVPVGTTLDEIEREMIRRAIAETGGNRSRAARMLGVSLRTLQRKLKAMAEEASGAGEDGPDRGETE